MTYRDLAREWLSKQPVIDPDPAVQRETDQQLIVDAYEIIQALLESSTQGDKAMSLLKDIVAQWEGAEWCDEAARFIAKAEGK